jgi:hypothetical protein
MQSDLAFPQSLAEKYRPVRLAKDCRNNVHDCLMRLEVELMAL